MSITIMRAARAEDLEAVLTLLREARLPEAGVADHFPEGFVVASEPSGALLGAAGLEAYGSAGLLRSVVVRADQRGTGLGQLLSREVVARAGASGVRDLFLLTTTAEGFFPRLGFQRVDRETLPEALGGSAELRGACPASAVAMRLALPV
jgi:amino-acid N-acetyltransferase